MDPFSANYNANANVDDGGCTCSLYLRNQHFGCLTGQCLLLWRSGRISDGICHRLWDSPTYGWTSGGTSETKTGLAAGTYTVTVSGDDCTDELEITITEPTEITYSVSATDATCGGGTDGTLTFTASGGAGTDYLFSIDNGSTFQGSGLFENLAADSYSILIQKLPLVVKSLPQVRWANQAHLMLLLLQGDASYCCW